MQFFLFCFQTSSLFTFASTVVFCRNKIRVFILFVFHLHHLVVVIKKLWTALDGMFHLALFKTGILHDNNHTLFFSFHKGSFIPREPSVKTFWQCSSFFLFSIFIKTDFGTQSSTTLSSFSGNSALRRDDKVPEFSLRAQQKKLSPRRVHTKKQEILKIALKIENYSGCSLRGNLCKEEAVLINSNGVSSFARYEFMALMLLSQLLILNLLLRVSSGWDWITRRFYAKIYFTRFYSAYNSLSTFISL